MAIFRLFSFLLVALLGVSTVSGQAPRAMSLFEDNAMLVATGNKLVVTHHDDSGKKVARPRVYFEADSRILSFDCAEERYQGTILLATAGGIVYRLTVAVTGTNHGTVTSEDRAILAGVEKVWFRSWDSPFLALVNGQILGYSWEGGSLSRRPEVDIPVPAGVKVAGLAYGGRTYDGFVYLADSAGGILWEAGCSNGVVTTQFNPLIASGDVTGVTSGTRASDPGIETVIFVSTKNTIERYDWNGRFETSVEVSRIVPGTMTSYYDSKISVVCREADGGRSVVEVQSRDREPFTAPMKMIGRKKISAALTTSSTGVIVN